MRIWNRARSRAALQGPLIRAGRSLCARAFVAEQVLEEVVAPFRRRRGPDDLEAAGDGVVAFAGPEFVLPAEALIFDRRAFGFGSDIDLRVRRPVGLAETMAAGEQRECLFVVHRHPLEGFAD